MLCSIVKLQVYRLLFSIVVKGVPSRRRMACASRTRLYVWWVIWTEFFFMEVNSLMTTRILPFLLAAKMRLLYSYVLLIFFLWGALLVLLWFDPETRGVASGELGGVSRGLSCSLSSIRLSFADWNCRWMWGLVGEAGLLPALALRWLLLVRWCWCDFLYLCWLGWFDFIKLFFLAVVPLEGGVDVDVWMTILLADVYWLLSILGGNFG